MPGVWEQEIPQCNATLLTNVHQEIKDQSHQESTVDGKVTSGGALVGPLFIDCQFRARSDTIFQKPLDSHGGESEALCLDDHAPNQLF